MEDATNTVEVSDDLLAKIEAAGLRQQIEELVSEERERHNEQMARILVAAGVRKFSWPLGIEEICAALKHQRRTITEIRAMARHLASAIERGQEALVQEDLRLLAEIADRIDAVSVAGGTDGGKR